MLTKFEVLFFLFIYFGWKRRVRTLTKTYLIVILAKFCNSSSFLFILYVIMGQFWDILGWQNFWYTIKYGENILPYCY